MELVFRAKLPENLLSSSVYSQSPNLSCLLEATSGTTGRGRGRAVVVVTVVVVVVLGVVLGGGGGGGLSLFLVVLSTPPLPSAAPSEPGSVFRRSTQHLMVWEGQGISSLTSSQSNEAKACKHLPGHSLTSAVLVMDPNNPVEKSLCQNFGLEQKLLRKSLICNRV